MNQQVFVVIMSTVVFVLRFEAMKLPYHVRLIWYNRETILTNQNSRLGC